MVMKAYLKTLLRLFKSNRSRFITTIIIVLIGVTFFTAIGTVSPRLRDSGNRYYVDNNISDIIVKNKTLYGFLQEEIKEINNIEYIKDVISFTTFDQKVEDDYIRVYYLPLSDLKQNILTLKEGYYPTKGDEILVERRISGTKRHNIGDIIRYNNQDLKVVGIVINPLIMSNDGEPSILNTDKNLRDIYYFDNQYYKDLVPVTDLYLKTENTIKVDIFSKDYRSFNDNLAKKIEDLSSENIALTLEDNVGVRYLEANADKLKVISYLFPVFFIVVVVLVVLTTMTRFVDEERSLIGCLKTLGYSNFAISTRYILFAILGCLIGSVGGVLLGSTITSDLIFNAFKVRFSIPTYNVLYMTFGIIGAIILSFIVISVTVFSSLKTLKEKPSSLLRYKAPRSGKKILLEYIPLIWKRLKFKYKSTFRNIFRYKRHFFMTVTCVAGATALIFAGFGLYQNTVALKGNNGSVSSMFETLSMISQVIIYFAIVLEVLVIFNLTNINISERNREIATLKVLGYKNNEVSGYIFREVFILSLIGILIGLPLGYYFVNVVLEYVEFGEVGNITYISWLSTFAISVLASLLVNLLLYRKIVKVDMNASLKTIE